MLQIVKQRSQRLAGSRTLGSSAEIKKPGSRRGGILHLTSAFPEHCRGCRRQTDRVTPGWRPLPTDRR